jgi:hypothetical protein
MNDETIKHAFEAGERLHERFAKGMRHTADGKAILTGDADWEMYLKLLKGTAKRLASTERAVTAPFKKWPSGIGYKLTPLGQDIRSLCVNALPLVDRAGRGFNLTGRTFQKADGTLAGIAEGEPHTITYVIPSPHITVMLRACLRVAHKLENYFTAEWGDVNEPRVRATYEWAARFVRRVCRSQPFKTVLDNHQRSAKKNLKSCLDYVTCLFEKYSKLLPIRIDLYIHPEQHEWSASAHAEKCISQYLRALRECRLIEPDVKGWIIKREGGFYRGIHFHLMVFLDGHKHKEGYVYSKQLGEAWMNRFSDGKGTYFNCWVLRKKYKYNALGVVHISDRAMLIGIRVAMAYFTKEDCALETGRSRNLRRGITLRLANKAKLGAPRKAENDVSMVKSVFSS